MLAILTTKQTETAEKVGTRTRVADLDNFLKLDPDPHLRDADPQTLRSYLWHKPKCTKNCKCTITQVMDHRSIIFVKNSLKESLLCQQRDQPSWVNGRN